MEKYQHQPDCTTQRYLHDRSSQQDFLVAVSLNIRPHFAKVKRNKASLVELIVVFWVIFRIVWFVENSLAYTIETERVALSSALAEKKAICDKFASLLASVSATSQQDAVHHLLSSKTMSELDQDVRVCSFELYELTAFTTNLSRHALLHDMLSSNVFRNVKSQKMLGTAMMPGRLVQCSVPLCVDWRSAFDVSLLFEIISPILLFSLTTIAFKSILASVLLTAVVYGGFTWLKRFTKESLLTGQYPRLKYPMIVNAWWLAKKMRLVRISVLVFIYFLAFIVFPNGSSLLFRAIVWILSFSLSQVVTLCVIVYIITALVIVHGTSISERFSMRCRQRKLAEINKFVAQRWVSDYLQILPRLGDNGLIEVLKISDLSAVSDANKDFINRIFAQRPLLVALRELAASFRRSDHSVRAVCARDVERVGRLLCRKTGPSWHQTILICASVAGLVYWLLLA